MSNESLEFIKHDSLILAAIALIKIHIGNFALNLAGDSVHETSGMGKSKDALSIFPFTTRGVNEKSLYHFIGGLSSIRKESFKSEEPVVLVTFGANNVNKKVISGLGKFINSVVATVIPDDDAVIFSIEKPSGVFRSNKKAMEKDKKHKLIASRDALAKTKRDYGQTLSSLGRSISGGRFYKFFQSLAIMGQILQFRQFVGIYILLHHLKKTILLKTMSRCLTNIC